MAIASREFRPDPRTLADVRSWLRQAARRWAVADEPTEVATLLVSELATNAILHAGTVFEVTISHEPGVLRVAVGDDTHQMPRIRYRAHPAEGGLGLKMLQALATRWGAEREPGDGKVVWFEIGA